MARSIVVGTDGSNQADEAVRQAIDLASREGARLHLVTAYHHQQILPETTIWTNDPKGVIDTSRTEARRPHTETVDLREVAESVLRARPRRRAEQGRRGADPCPRGPTG